MILETPEGFLGCTKVPGSLGVSPVVWGAGDLAGSGGAVFFGGPEATDAGLNRKLHSWQRKTSLSWGDFLLRATNLREWQRRHCNNF